MNIVRNGAKVFPEKWCRYKYNLTNGIGKNGERITGCREHIQLSREAATEGMVLLENNGILPLKENTTVSLFGIGSIDYVMSGSGSGMVFSSYVRNIYDGFVEKSPRIKIYEPVTKFYYDYVSSRLDDYDIYRLFAEIEVPRQLIADAAENSDIAIITIHHSSGEGYDRSSKKGDFYLTDIEQKMVDNVTAAFAHCVVVLNTGGITDVSWIKSNPKIEAVLLAWQAGMEGGLAIADILCGDVNPSGKLTDTFAKEFDDYPGTDTFNDSQDYVCYFEDIYVGYRYFETIPKAYEKVIYPFGYGLSYTTFDISKPIAIVVDDKIRVTVSVKNTGNFPGKEVVQVYFSSPQGVLGKSRLTLSGFKKTKLLDLGETEEIIIDFKISDMASYDDVGKLKISSYLLEKGEYIFYVGNSCRNVKAADYCYVVKDDFFVTEQLSQKCAPVKLEKRMLADGRFEELPSFEIKEFLHSSSYKKDKAFSDDLQTILLNDVCSGKYTLDDFISRMTDEEITMLLGGIPSRGVCNSGGFGGIDRIKVPAFMTADGPAGLRLLPQTGIATTAFPCATLIACTWNTDLMYEIGRAGALELKENGIAVWLTPAMNIHRNPLCGRNFEYFSEDPLVSGKFAAAEIKGIQSVKTAACVKHFVCNNKETNRRYSDSWVSERALREIYLRGFEICVKDAQPWVIMNSYNIVNGRRCCSEYELNQCILRDEWGFNGVIITDWSTPCDEADCVNAGNDIRMPEGDPNALRLALDEGRVNRSQLELCAKRILELIMKFD